MSRGQREGRHAVEQLTGKEPASCDGQEPACHRAEVHRAHGAVGLLFVVLLPFASMSADDQKPYQVRDGTKVDAKTLNGWKTWRALACERCHGAAQEGLVGPSLVESLKTLTKEDFHTTLMEGKIDKGMPSFNTSKMVNENWEGLYAYLKGRSDGAIQPGHLQPLNE